MNLFYSALFLLPVAFAQVTITFQDVSITAPNVYYKEIPAGTQSSIIVRIQNTENANYRVNIRYTGQLPVTLEGPSGVLATGVSFISPYVNIPPKGIIYLYLKYNPATTGFFTNTITFNVEREAVVNNTTVWSPVGSYSYTLQLKVVKQTTTTTQTTQKQEATKQLPEKCLIPLRSKIYKILYLNDTITVSVGFINQCSNTTIELLDADIEGVPPDIAYITQTELKHQLEPGEVQYVKVAIDTTHLTKPTELVFDVILIGKANYKVETARTTIDVRVIVPSEVPQKTEEEQTHTAKQLHVDYVIKNGYLVIKGVYYIVNNTKYYLTDVPIYILTDEGQILYYRPVPVEPGKTYCISITLKGFVPYFECITAPKKDLCITIEPPPKVIAGKYYVKADTKITIQGYDCNTNTPLDIRIFVDGMEVKNNTITLSPGTHTIKVLDGAEYNSKTITVIAFAPPNIKITPKPQYPGNYTIQIQGLVIPNAELTIYCGSEEIYSGTGIVHKVTLPKPCLYKYIIKTTYGTFEGTIRIFSNITTTESSTPSIPVPSIIIIGLAAFVVFTIIAFIITKTKGMSFQEAAAEISKVVK